MKKSFIHSLLCVFPFGLVQAQSNNTECGCPVNQFTETKAEAVFNFSNGKAIAACGYKNLGDGQPTFSEFVLAVCGENKVIDFWDATTLCHLSSEKDTLFVQQIYTLPIGENFQLRETIWTTEKLYFSGNKVNRKKSVNPSIRKYDAKEIKRILEAYRNAGTDFDESKMEIANQLFVATLSGSKEARSSFLQFKDRFNLPDGAYSQEYRVLREMLEMWETEK